jgi:phosphate/sulfate permease
MKFEKREILLIVGVLFLMIGMMSVLAPIYALVIAILVYFGIKVFVGRKKRQIQKEIGQGICAVCGGKISDGKCPRCDLQ